MSGKKPARQHHYIPQLYLRGLARKPSKKAKIHVYDMHKMDWLLHPTNPKNIGTVRDFNRVDMEGHPVDALENSLSQFESEAAKALRRIWENCNRPTDGDFIYLINLIALISVRNPRTRETFRDFKKESFKRITALTLASRERWEASVKQMKEAGYGTNLHEVSYEQMLRFHQEGEYDIRIANQAFYEAEFSAIDTVIKTLLDRKWLFLVADTNAGHFVSCDHPVRLRWNEPKLAGGFYPPGHGMKSTEVVFPVSKNLAMVGCFEGREGTLVADRKMVAVINQVIIEGCARHVYSPDNEFVFVGPDRKIYRSRDIPRLLRGMTK